MRRPAVRSSLAWTEDGRHLRLASPALADHEHDRMASLSPETFTRSLSALKLAPPMSAGYARGARRRARVEHLGSERRGEREGLRREPLGVSLRGGDLAASIAPEAAST
jgi:hypothetical protein